MTSDGKDYAGYRYDAFGRLRKVYVNSNDTGLVSEYRYNGLSMKIGWHYDSMRSGGRKPSVASSASTCAPPPPKHRCQHHHPNHCGNRHHLKSN